MRDRQIEREGDRVELDNNFLHFNALENIYFAAQDDRGLLTYHGLQYIIIKYITISFKRTNHIFHVSDHF